MSVPEQSLSDVLRELNDEVEGLIRQVRATLLVTTLIMVVGLVTLCVVLFTTS